MSIEAFYEMPHRHERGAIYKRYSLVDGECVQIEPMKLEQHGAQFLPICDGSTTVSSTDDFLNGEHPAQAKDKLREILKKKCE